MACTARADRVGVVPVAGENAPAETRSVVSDGKTSYFLLTLSQPAVGASARAPARRRRPPALQARLRAQGSTRLVLSSPRFAEVTYLRLILPHCDVLVAFVVGAHVLHLHAAG